VSGPGGGAIRGIGVDAVDLDRFRATIRRRPQLVDRLFSAGERADVAPSVDPLPRLAARFAAKEAVMKALGVGIGAFAFTDVEVVSHPGGAPGLRLRGGAAVLADGAGVGSWHVSLTHTGLVAVASVVAVVAEASDVAGVAHGQPAVLEGQLAAPEPVAPGRS